MKKKILLPLLVLCVLIAGFLISRNFNQFFPRKVHYHAGFVVFVDGKHQDFTDTKYMDLQPCTQNNLGADEQEAKAHLHEGIGDVVHVHRSNATWNDLFLNIHFPIDTSKHLEGYVNGTKLQDIFSQQIHPYDSLVLLIGTHGPVSDYLKQAVVKSHILTIEKTSELCGS